MPLYELDERRLTSVPTTTYAALGLLERKDLQQFLKADIGVIAGNVLIVAEEFGEWEDARRRIDLLGVDRLGRLVVIELKRTEDGGHVELQALRYAAMVSTMTFDQLASTYQRHLDVTQPEADEDASEKLAEWLDSEDAVLSRDVRIILVAAGFTREITTTVLWLNDVHGMDITCIRLVPYAQPGRPPLIDVQQVIPLPEAAEYQVKIRHREAVIRAVASSGKDYTKYIVITPSGRSDPLSKRAAVLTMVQAVHGAGVSLDLIREALTPSKFQFVPGTLSGAALAAAWQETWGRSPDRYFAMNPFHGEDRTYLLTAQWGRQTEARLIALAALTPKVEFEAVEPTTLG